ncbi:unnamed protein product [Phytomonas sp. EM1]|nr:unnamed protein product [Phytomonas sp. EM1]|eukprot:CCW64924.1 unnamed protein product [Phytomonas sp. isolate EM1]
MTVADERDERGQLIEKEEALEWGCLLRRSRAALEELFYGRYVRRIIQEEAIRREILFLRVREEHAVLVCTSKELRGRQSVEMLERKARKLLAGREASALYYVIRNSKAMKVLLSQEVTERRRLQELEQFRSLYLFNIFFPEMFERIGLRDFESRLRRKIIQGARDSALNLSLSRKVVVADSRARLPPRECVNSCSDSHLFSTSDTTTSTGGASPHLRSSAVLNMVATVKSAVANGLLVGSRVNSGGGVASPLSNTSPTLLEAKPRSQLLAVEQRARADLEEICDAEFLRIIRLRANTIHNCYRKQIQTVAQRAMQSSQDELCALRKHIALLEARLKEPVSGAPPESLQSF